VVAPPPLLVASVGDDPWGVVMLAFGVLSVGGLVAVAISVAVRRSARIPTLLLGTALGGFLAASIGGALVRVLSSDESAAAPPPVAATAPTPEDDPAPKPVDEDAPGDDEDEEPAAEEATDGAIAQADEEANPPEPTPDEDVAPSDDADPVANAAPDDAPPPLPDDPEELQRVMRLLFIEIRKLGRDNTRCNNAGVVVETWKRLAATPADTYPSHRAKAARTLEKCRRKAVWATRYQFGRERISGREALAEAIAQRLSTDRVHLFSRVSGRDKDQLRFGNPRVTEDQVLGWMTADLEKEFADAGFSRVVFFGAEKYWRYDLEPVSEEGLVREEIAARGLADPFRFE
jgi:hypothetical protein